MSVGQPAACTPPDIHTCRNHWYSYSWRLKNIYCQHLLDIRWYLQK